MADNSTTSAPLKSHSIGKIALEFLGSMNLAISLLVAVAIASVIGTVLQQNQPYADYTLKFGLYWSEVFESLGLFDLYSAGWFLVILGFLLLSTSVCVYRNTPIILREMRSWRLNVQLKSLRAFQHKQEWKSPQNRTQSRDAVEALLRNQGFQIKHQPADGHTLIAARKGGANRIGYLLTHISIVIICLGGLLDSRMPFKVAEMLGNLKAETRNFAAADVPEISRLPLWNPTLRGNVDIPEGQSANFLFIGLRDGYLVQDLPFSIELKDFRVEHYSTGQPKSFESDLIIHDDQLAEPLEQTISVNHPLIYRGYAIYQASFGDGGSLLKLRAWPLGKEAGKPYTLEGEVLNSLTLHEGGKKLKLEFADFRLFNISPITDDDGVIHQRNFGPSFNFKVRNASGQAIEFNNFMQPTPQEGNRLFFISGMRTEPNEPFIYLHIPADPKGGIDRFMALLAKLHDRPAMAQLALASAKNSLQQSQLDPMQVAESMFNLLNGFLDKGLISLEELAKQNVPPEKQAHATEVYLQVLQELLSSAYRQVLIEEGIKSPSQADIQFFDDTLTTLSTLPAYQSPFLLQLESFEQIQASGLQITRSPGKSSVYLGCVLLIVGVFLLFYVNQRRLWIWIEERDGRSWLLFAASSQRQSPDFDREFNHLNRGLRYKTDAAESAQQEL